MSRRANICTGAFLALAILASPIRAQNLDDQTRADNFALGNAIWVLYHEIGHLLISEFQLPVLGREEDAADHLATVVMLEDPSEVLDSFLVAAVEGFFRSASAQRANGRQSDFANEHGLNEQRAFEVACLMLGNNAQVFKGLADEIKLPEYRRKTCRGDYQMARSSWFGVLAAHRPGGWWSARPPARVSYSYGPVAVRSQARDLAPVKQLMRDARVLEEVTEYLEKSFDFKREIRVEMEACGKPNAFFQPERSAVIVCYELINEFRNMLAPEIQ
ncbi:MAG: DUF4344 domain-containing metallopeptidase [Alphaproteobacteria bacterium]